MTSPALRLLPPMDMAAMIEKERETSSNYTIPVVKKVDSAVSSDSREIPIRSYSPEQPARSDSLLIWFHGGAFIGGSLDMPEAEIVSYEIAARAGFPVVSVDYRLCNQVIKFPAPQQDALAVLNKVIADFANNSIPHPNIFIGGASAGGCLAGALSLIARDQGINLAGVIPIYPIAHAVLPNLSSEIQDSIKGKFSFSPEFILEHNAWLSLALTETESQRWHPFPADSADLSAQADFLVIDAEIDSLRASGESWSQKLQDSGVKVTRHISEAGSHGYLNNDPRVDRNMDETLQLMANFLTGQVQKGHIRA